MVDSPARHVNYKLDTQSHVANFYSDLLPKSVHCLGWSYFITPLVLHNFNFTIIEFRQSSESWDMIRDFIAQNCEFPAEFSPTKLVKHYKNW